VQCQSAQNVRMTLLINPEHSQLFPTPGCCPTKAKPVERTVCLMRGQWLPCVGAIVFVWLQSASSMIMSNQSHGLYVTVNNSVFAGLVNTRLLSSHTGRISDDNAWFKDTLFQTNKLETLQYTLKLDVQNADNNASSKCIVCLSIMDSFGNGINNRFESYRIFLGNLYSWSNGSMNFSDNLLLSAQSQAFTSSRMCLKFPQNQGFSTSNSIISSNFLNYSTSNDFKTLLTATNEKYTPFFQVTISLVLLGALYLFIAWLRKRKCPSKDKPSVKMSRNREKQQPRLVRFLSWLDSLDRYHILRALKILHQIVDSVTDFLLLLSLTIIWSSTPNIFLSNIVDGSALIAIPEMIINQLAVYSFDNSLCGPGTFEVYNSRLAWGTKQLSYEDTLRSGQNHYLQIHCQGNFTQISKYVLNDLTTPCVQSTVLGFDSQVTKYACDIFYSPRLMWILFCMIWTFILKEFMFYSYSVFLADNISITDQMFISRNTFCGTYVFVVKPLLVRVLARFEWFPLKREWEDTRFLPVGDNLSMTRLFPGFTLMFVFLDLLGRVSSICFAWILLRESKSLNTLAIVSIITSFLGFLKYFGQWSYRLRKLLFSFDPSDYVPENLGRRDYFSLTLKHSSLSVSTGV
jgi:hypothetical protein